MSRSFLNIYRNFIKFIENNYKLYKFIPFKIQVGLSVTILGGHSLYAYGTKSTNEIYVNNKYMYTQNGFTEFMIIDNSGKHYNVNNSFWYWKWNSIEDWNNINSGDTLNIKYYGYRIPLFGIFPNIVHIQNISSESFETQKQKVNFKLHFNSI